MTAARTRVLLADDRIAARRDALAARLAGEFDVVVPAAFTETALAEAARDADALVAHTIAPVVLEAAPRVRLVQLWIAGVDHLDLARLALLPVRVAAAHENARTVAELALAHVLAGGRGVALGDRRLRQGDWSVGRFGGPPGHATYGATVGIVGYGAIGRAFAALARGFEYRLLAVKRRPDPVLARADGLAFLGGPDDLDRVLAESDFVLVTLPRTAATTGWLDARRLAAMKRTGWLVLVGRFEVVDEEALYVACRDRRIAGAGVDVWTQTPPPALRLPSRFPFHELDNVVMTPHCAGWTHEALASQLECVAVNLERFRRGEPLHGLVDLIEGY